MLGIDEVQIDTKLDRLLMLILSSLIIDLFAGRKRGTDTPNKMLWQSSTVYV